MFGRSFYQVDFLPHHLKFHTRFLSFVIRQGEAVFAGCWGTEHLVNGMRAAKVYIVQMPVNGGGGVAVSGLKHKIALASVFGFRQKHTVVWFGVNEA